MYSVRISGYTVVEYTVFSITVCSTQVVVKVESPQKMARLKLSTQTAVISKKNGVFAINAVAPWGESDGRAVAPPELALGRGVGMVLPPPPSPVFSVNFALPASPPPFWEV